MLLALALMANAVIAAPSRPAPSPSAYAWGWPIEAQGPADYYEFTLPLAVYRSVADPELRDVGVFDARGEPVPRWIGKAAAPVPAAGEVRELTVLPVHAPPGTPAGEMKLALERRGDQMTVRIDETAPGAAGARALVAGIADLGGLRADLRAVDLGGQCRGQHRPATVVCARRRYRRRTARGRREHRAAADRARRA
jgi:hypothetical protein